MSVFILIVIFFALVYVAIKHIDKKEKPPIRGGGGTSQPERGREDSKE